MPKGADAVFSGKIGYVQHVDMQALANCAEESGGKVFVAALPGTFVDPGRELAFLEKGDAETHGETIRDAFSIATERTYDQDPRFGFLVLTEIACRALSPAVNDPGTAIDVIGRVVRLMSNWSDDVSPDEPEFPDVLVPAILPGAIFDDVFLPIGRDGAAMAEVHIRLQKALAVLARAGDGRLRTEAVRHSKLALARAEANLTFQHDMDRVTEAAKLLAKR